MINQSKQARLAVIALFFINGFIFSSWIPHIPLVQEHLNIGEGRLGFALLAIALGAILFMPLSGIWSAQYGSKKVCIMSAVILCVSLPFISASDNIGSLMITLFIFGASGGTMDVAMNAQAVIVEKECGRPIMSSFHGFFSLGGLTGSSIGGILLTLGCTQQIHLTTIGIFATIASIYMGRFLQRTKRVKHSQKISFAMPSKSLLGLSLLAFIVLMAEGSIADWSAVYLKNNLGSSIGLAAAGYASFSLMMAVARFTGDRMVSGIGAATLTRITAIIAAMGLGVALMSQNPLIAILGFGAVGLGLANLIPVIFSAAGRNPDMEPSHGIAAVATMGYFGFLAGPPIIGLIAELTSLSIALGMVALTILIVSAFAGLTVSSTNKEW